MYWITGLLGLAAVISPYVFGFQSESGAFWTATIAGLLLFGLSVLEGIERDRDNLEYWVAGIVGVGALAAPFLLGFSNNTTAMWAAVGIGVLAIVLSGFRILAPPTTTTD